MTKLNKTFQIVKSLKNGEYQRYLDGDIVLQDIADQFGVSVQHVAAIIKDNKIGEPSKQKKLYKEEEQVKVKDDIENGLPIDYFKNDYRIFNNLSGTMNVFNTITRWVKRDQIHLDIPYITESKLKKLILYVNIMKYIKRNNNYPKQNKKRLSDIAEMFNVSFGVVGSIASYIKKGTNNLLPNKNEELVKIIIRNLDMVEDITYTKDEHEEAIKKASKKYGVDLEMVKRILVCEPYVEGANIDDFIILRQEM